MGIGLNLRFSHILSLLLPGFVAILALRHVNETTNGLLANPSALNLAGGVWLLILALTSGGVIDAVRRAIIDPLISKAKPTEAWSDYLTPENRELFAEEGVQNSYKYYEFYANLALSIMALLAVRLFFGHRDLLDILLAGTVLVLCVAAWNQWGYFVKFIAGFIRSQKGRKGAMIWNNPPTGTDIHTVSDIGDIPRGTEGRLRGTTGYPDDRPDDIFVVDFPTQKRVIRVRRDQIEETMRR